MTMLNNTSPYAATAPGIRRGATIFFARLSRHINRWIAAVIAHRERQATLVVLRHLSDRDLKDIGISRSDMVTLWRRGQGSDRGCKIPSDPEGTRTLANQPRLARA
jgi:uncharacterized protein YjiS (DUF1127 family)